MRALYFADTYPPQVNGVSVVTHLSVEGLAARGWEVGVVAPSYPDGDDVFKASGSSVLLSLPSVPFPGYSDIRLAAPLLGRARALVDRFEPDVIHCATEGTIGWLGQRIARSSGIPLATSYHTNFGHYMRSYGMGWLEGAVTRYLIRFHARANRTLTPSRVSWKELVSLGIDHAMVWGCGVDTETFHPDRRSSALRRELGVDDRFVFLHVGRLAPEKSVDRLLEAFGRCRAELGEQVHLIVAGSGPSRRQLEAAAPDGVTFLGFLDRATDLPRLYASADAFVFSSETETLGLVILEAMASGLPVLAAPAGGVADHLRHGVNGLAYPAGDGDTMAAFMAELVVETKMRESLAAGARETAVALGWARELDRLDVCYRELVQSGAGAIGARQSRQASIRPALGAASNRR